MQIDLFGAAGITAVGKVGLLHLLLAGDADFLRIDHNDEVAHIHMRGVGRFVLPLQDLGYP